MLLKTFFEKKKKKTTTAQHNTAQQSINGFYYKVENDILIES